MKVTVDAQALREGLKFSCASPGPIESTRFVRLRAPVDGQLELATTSMDCTTWMRVPVENIEEPDECAVPESLFRSLLQGLDGIVELTGDGIRQGKAFWRMPSIEAGELPIADDQLDEADALDADPAELAAAIRKVRYAHAKKDVRYYLNGVHLGDRAVSATDGHRLAHVNGQADTPEMIVPYPALDRVLDVLDAGAGVYHREGALVLIGEGVSLAAKLINGRYPAVDAVIPGDADANNIVRVPTAPLKAALTRLTAIAAFRIEGMKDKEPVVHIEAADGELRLRVGESVEPVDPEAVDGQLDVHLNGRYLRDVLNQAGETLEWRSRGEAKQAQLFITGEGERHVIMPCDPKDGGAP